MVPGDFFEALRARTEARLHALLDRTEGHARELAPPVLPMLEAARALTLRGGKRLRPALVFAAIECVHPSDFHGFGGAAVDLGCALELMQTYLLIHDDWMDGDRVRRGAPSVHAALEAHYGDTHLGQCAAILAGDLMSAVVHDTVAMLALPPETLRDVLGVFARMEREVIFGQCLDVTRDPDIERIHRLKTGSYTVRGPLQLGLAFASATKPLREALDRFAAPLGLAFQLRDDVLGVFGSPEETGKPTGGDLREGKQTALVAHALKALRGSERAELVSALGHGDSSESLLLRARELIEGSGAREAAEARIEALRAEALAVLSAERLREEGRSLLAALTERVCRRSR